MDRAASSLKGTQTNGPNRSLPNLEYWTRNALPAHHSKGVREEAGRDQSLPPV